MDILVGGRIAQFVGLLIVMAFVSFFMYWGKRVKAPPIRRLAGLDAIDEAVGRATEVGKPIFFVTAPRNLYGEDAPKTIAAMSVLSYVSHRAFRNSVPMYVMSRAPDAIPLINDIVYQAALAEGKVESYKPENYTFALEESLITESIGLLDRRRPAVSLLMGRFGADCIAIAETGNRVGAIQIAGTPEISQVPVLMTMCDYVLIGEELYAAGAYIDANPVSAGAFRGLDVSKLFWTAAILIGVILATLGIDVLKTLLKM